MIPVHCRHDSVLPLVGARVKLSVHLSHRNALGVQLVDHHLLVAKALQNVLSPGTAYKYMGELKIISSRFRQLFVYPLHSCVRCKNFLKYLPHTKKSVGSFPDLVLTSWPICLSCVSVSSSTCRLEDFPPPVGPTSMSPCRTTIIS